MLAAVQQNGYALQYASEELKNDRKLVLAAVKEDREALQFASEELRNDQKIVSAAMRTFNTPTMSTKMKESMTCKDGCRRQCCIKY